MSHEITSKETYSKVLMILLVLTVLTVVASRFDFGFLNTFVAIGIATIKASFVGAVFMNLKGSGKVNIAVFCFSVFFLIVLFSFCALDIFTRVPLSSTL